MFLFPQVKCASAALMLMLGLGACGCVDKLTAAPQLKPSTSESGKPMAKDPRTASATPSVTRSVNDKGRVALGWQKKMIAALAASSYSDAWGLFSSGGWSDNGQVMLLTSQQQADAAKALVVAPNQPDGTPKERLLSSSEFSESIAPLLSSAADLEDVDVVAFDALTYEFVHAHKDPQGEASVVKRIYIRNPTPDKVKMPRHEALIKAMLSLRNAP